MASAEQFVTIGAGEGLFAAPVAQVQEILDLAPIAHVPRSAPSLLGLIDVRGRSVPVLDLRDLLGVPRGEDGVHTRVIVLTLGGAGGGPQGGRVVGLKSDRVFEVTALDADALDPAPGGGEEAGCGGAIRGIGRRNGAFVTVLDVERLVESELGAGASI
ncbi:MAG: chemotaxis protein CheW [Rubrimonas sp.]|uniref:chemotaxis protein CheW n=1 Tax=Rubrimonas sp. TaxID=2036015 RepID=UPI002FDD5868